MNQVAVVHTEPCYPTSAPYHPSEEYPEYPFSGRISLSKNLIYAGVRRLFCLLGLDQEQQGTKEWNPLGRLIEPGMTVVLKPNLVLSRHKAGKDLYSIITHPSVLRAVADYCWIALRGQGRIIIADAPQYDCDFQELLAATRLDQVTGFYDDFAGPQVELYDLRTYWSRWKHFASLLEPLPGDPQGSITVNLGRHSALYDKPHLEKLYGAVYNRDETITHHIGCRHEYELSRTVVNADVVISVPKLKVHKKVGVTLNAKGLVGVCTNKNYLVHYTLTPPSEGGDQYPDDLFSPLEERLIETERWMYDHLLAPRKPVLEYLHRSIYWLHNHTTRRLGIKVAEEKRLFDAGNWYGNDSAWRMTVDLMKAFHFADGEGRLQSTPQRRMFSIIDGIVGGDNNGPLTPDPVPAGVLIAGENLLAVDLVAVRLMGFDPLKLRLYQSLVADPDYDFGVHCLDDIQVISQDPLWATCLTDTSNRFLDFVPHPGWVGHVEIQPKDRIVAFPTQSQ
jgi:uncharacterized protein (DUF362 family)